MEDLLLKLKAIGDETRLNIIKLLLQKNFCVQALARRLNISESSVSQHLKVLREADLVMGVKKGYFVHYQVKLDNLKSVGNQLIDLRENQQIDDCCRKDR